MNAATALVRTLVAHGVDRAFCVPGESYLPVLDALHDTPQIPLVTCRHEGGAGFMALADSKLTRRPGVLFVSRGPGAANGSVAIHLAAQDFAPLVMFVGQVERADRGRGAFQEVDYAKAFGGLCKRVWEVNDGAQLAQVCAEAFAVTMDDLPGPVIISMPEDMLLDEAGGAVAPIPATAPPSANGSVVADIAQRLSVAKRPIVLAGSGVRQEESRLLVALAEKYGVPVVAEWKQQHLFPNRHPNYGGHMGNTIPKTQLELMKSSDLVLAVGALLDDLTTQGYRFPALPKPTQPLIHVHPAKGALQRAYRADVRLQADSGDFLRKLLDARPERQQPREGWISELCGYARRFMAWQPVQASDGIVFGAAMDALNRVLPGDAIVTHDAGNFSAWMHRYFFFRDGQTLVAGIGGAMGLGVPAAIAASLRHPSRKAVCLVGDGGMLMTGAELATATMYGATPLIVLSNNNTYGTIRAYQNRLYPGRGIATDLKNPDFVALARSFGADAWRVDDVSELESTLALAVRSQRAALVEVTTSPSHLSAYANAP